MRPEVRISDQLTEDAARLLADAAERGGHVVITGGSTPKAAYNRVTELGADWSGTEIWFSDERCVAPDHEHSNFRMADEALLSKIEPRAVHRRQGERGPDDGAREYQNELAAVFGEVLPDTTSDEQDPESAEQRDEAQDRWLRSQVPPHHG